MSSNQSPFHSHYRKDIDGLRALAVMLVVVFHAFPERLSGGFIGVDIFFVISGFLISKILIENLANNTFSFTDFYLRRVRRIFPALILVLSFCIIFGWFFLFPDEYRLLGKHVFSSGIFIQNLNLLSEVGYFNEAAETKPLLHLWSLGIEEQFYLIWPLLLWLGCKLKIKPLILISTLGLISFFINLLNATSNPNFAFFSPVTRFWELLVGGCLAGYILQPNQSIQKKLSNIDLSLLGLVLICAGVIAISPSSIFPGLLALLPTLGAFLIISAGPNGFVNNHILSRRFMVHLGLISYPLYLWHWALLALARISESGEVSEPTRIGIVLTSTLLAFLTYWLIEQPIQNGSFTKQKNIALVLSMLSLVFIGKDIYMRDGLAFRSYSGKYYEQLYSNPVNDSQEKEQHGFIEGFNCQSYEGECAPVSTNRKKIVIWGDSHAQMLSHGIRENIPANWTYFIITQPGCKPEIVESKRDSQTECQKINYFATQQIKKIAPEIVLLAQRDEWIPKNVASLQQNLKAMGAQRVLYLGKSPEWTAKLPKIIAREIWRTSPKYSKSGLNFNALKLEEVARKEFQDSDDQIYLNLIKLFCNGDGCLVYLGDDIASGITSFDTNHLSPKASSFAIQELVIPYLK